MMFLILGIGLSVQSRAANFERYENWKDRPQEKFTSGEESFKLAMDKILAQYVEKGISKEDLYRAATAGMLESLNTGDASWNKLLTPTELKDLQGDLSGQVSGIGIGLKFDEATGNGLIIDVIPNSPSMKAGLKRDDQILSVNSQRFKGKQLKDIVFAIRGKIGEDVAMKVLRDDQVISVKLKREVIPWTPVEISKLDSATQLLTIGYFTGETPKLVEAQMAAINATQIKTLLIDLRNNTGGSFEKAVKTAELFVPKGKAIVSTRSREGKIETLSSQKGLLRKDIKVILLTNSETSSGAELFSGALRDEASAKIVGEKTLGKWNAQMIESLPNGFAIKFTTQYFQTPNGDSYQNVGMKPDVEVVLPKDLDAGELRSKYEIPKRLQLDTQLKAATELARAM